MPVNQLPPQAYTKETLARAYEWLRHQTPQVRELATSAEMLIGLYTRAQRHGDEALERPSLQNFKSELKNLAGIMGEFSDQQQSPPKIPTAAPAVNPQATTASYNFELPPSMPMPPPRTHQAPQPQQNHANASSMHFEVEDPTTALDIKSRTMIHEVKNQLNLSSDAEALRLVISLGFHKSRTLWSKE
ncbi:MAG: hypothetical protein AB7H97_04660 [Pseudobdellovibrionaceae bacterium]